MALLIQFAPVHAGSMKQNEQDAQDAVEARTGNGRLTAAARWWWLNWTKFAQGRLEK